MTGVIVKAAGPQGWGTRMINAETGEEIRGVAAMSIRIVPDEFISIQADIFSAGIEVNGEAEFRVTDPATGEKKTVARVEFADGSEWKA